MTEQTQPTDAELEACPFCGNADAIVYDDLLTFHAGCLSCGSTGSVSSYRNGAIAAWNRRAVLAKWGTPAGAGDVAEVMFADGKRYIQYTVPKELLPIGTKLYTPTQPTKAQAVNQADRPFIVRLAEDFAEECVTAGYVTTKAASYGRLMDEALSTQAQAGAVQLTGEQERAVREAYESAVSESYFSARPQIDTNDRRRVFKAGFERGWDAKTGADHA